MKINKEPPGTLKFWEAKQEIVNRMLAKLDLAKLTDVNSELFRLELHQVVDKVCDALHPGFDRVTRDILTNEIVSEVLRGQIRDLHQK
jgi:hypothetical protein